MTRIFLLFFHPFSVLRKSKTHQEFYTQTTGIDDSTVQTIIDAPLAENRSSLRDFFPKSKNLL